MHLSDLFLEFFTFIRYLAEFPEAVDPDHATVRQDVGRLIARMERKAKKLKIGRSHFDAARFAAFAWADEAVLCSSWPGSRQWLAAPLQREYYGTVNAGEEFFERLDTLLGRTSPGEYADLLQELTDTPDPAPSFRTEHGDVLEVYALCLGLGFTGRYFNDSDSGTLAGLREDCITRITGKSTPTPIPSLSPRQGGKSRCKPAHDRIFDSLSIALALVSLLITGTMFLAYRGLLEHGLHLWFR